MGTRHAVNLHRLVGGVQVGGLYDADASRLHQAAALCGGAPLFDDPRHMVQDPGIQALVIASPDDTHVEYVLECLRLGKPVLCEKPLATSVADAERVISAEISSGKRLISLGFMRRFDPQHAAVYQAARSGQIGRPLLYKGVHRNASIPYDVSGEVILTNSAGHDIDAARWLLGQQVQEVYVRGVRSRAAFSENTRDLLLIQLALSDGCLAAIEVFVAAQYGYEVSAELVGEQGSAATLQPDYALLRCSGQRSQPIPGEWLERFQQAYVAELCAWVASLQAGEHFSGASAWDGYLALLITAACIRSLRSGLPESVSLPETPAFYS